MNQENEPKVPAGYTAEELEKDNPYNQWLREESFQPKKHKPPLVIYHKNCADGFGAAWVFHHMQDQVEQHFDFHGGVYSETPPDVTGRIVYLVDFSYKRDVVKQMCEQAHAVYLIDHHKTAVDDLKGLEDEMNNFIPYTDMNRSGAMLAWDFWNNTRWEDNYSLGWPMETYTPGHEKYVEPPILLGYIQDRDLWRFKLPESKEVSAFIFSTKYDFAEWDELMKMNYSTIPNAMVAGKAILLKQDKDMEEFAAASLQYWEVCGYIIPVVNAPYMWGSDIAHRLLSKFPDAPFAGYYWIGADNVMTWGFRSEDKRVDVADIASRLGGGGHRNASGCKVEAENALCGGWSTMRPYTTDSSKLRS